MDLFVENKEHRVYERTYLLLVKLRLNFSVDYDAEGVFEAFRDFFRKVFDLPFDTEKFKLMRYSSLSLSNKKKGFSVKFRNGYVRVEFEGYAYRSFEDSIVPFLANLVGLISNANGKICRASIQKVNAWDFNAANSDVEANMHRVLGDELTKNWGDIGFSEEQRGLTTTMSAKEPEYLNVVLSFGYVRPGQEGIDNRIVLDTEGICDSHEELLPHRIDDTLRAVNNALYNIYHWAVTPDVIESMKEGEK